MAKSYREQESRGTVVIRAAWTGSINSKLKMGKAKKRPNSYSYSSGGSWWGTNNLNKEGQRPPWEKRFYLLSYLLSFPTKRTPEEGATQTCLMGQSRNSGG